nr:NAD-dependent epimerase/dehydratase family protein [Flavobacterium sp.]
MTGGNGMIGSLILNKCLDNPKVKNVTSIVRKSTTLTHSKLKEIVHTNFLDFYEIEENFRNQDVCFYCLGVYTGQVPRDEFAKITIDFTRAFAEILRKNSDALTFCFLSGQGADRVEKSKIMFAKDNGVAENILFKLNFSKTHVFRPGYIYPVTSRKEPNFSYALMRFFYKPIISSLLPFMAITSEQLANAMVKVGLTRGNQEVYENNSIRKI